VCELNRESFSWREKYLGLFAFNATFGCCWLWVKIENTWGMGSRTRNVRTKVGCYDVSKKSHVTIMNTRSFECALLRPTLLKLANRQAKSILTDASNSRVIV